MAGRATKTLKITSYPVSTNNITSLSKEALPSKDRPGNGKSLDDYPSLQVS
jgi:hypothetical protein